MSDIESRYHTNLLEYGFKELSTTNELSGIGRLYSVPKEYGEGTYWIYSEKIYTTSKYMISVFTKTHSLISVFRKAAWEFVTMSPYLEKKSLLIAA